MIKRHMSSGSDSYDSEEESEDSLDRPEAWDDEGAAFAYELDFHACGVLPDVDSSSESQASVTPDSACAPPPPAPLHTLTVDAGAQPLHTLEPSFVSVAVDYMPTIGILDLDLEDEQLIRLASSLAPGLLRLGGSAGDATVFAHSPADCAAQLAAGHPGTAAGYVCKGPPTNCLTAVRWEAWLRFANRTGLRPVLGLNGCFGRFGLRVAWRCPVTALAAVVRCGAGQRALGVHGRCGAMEPLQLHAVQHDTRRERRRLARRRLGTSRADRHAMASG